MPSQPPHSPLAPAAVFAAASPAAAPFASYVSVDPGSLAATAARLRGLGSGGAGSSVASPAPLPDSLYDVSAVTPTIPGTGSGVVRFVGAFAAASEKQAGRVRELLAYGDAASGALGWFADSVTEAEGTSATELERRGGGLRA